jgi:hypothetical protein
MGRGPVLEETRAATLILTPAYLLLSSTHDLVPLASLTPCPAAAADAERSLHLSRIPIVVMNNQ